MTNIPELKGNWDEQKVKLRQKYSMLSDKDLTFEAGKKDAMLERVQIILGKTKGDLYKIIEAL